MRQNRADNLNFVFKGIRKQRAYRTVNQTRNQNFAFRRLAFPFHKAAGYLAGCIIFFLIVDGQREEILICLYLFRGANGRQHLGFTISNQYGALGLPCYLSCF